MFCEFLDDVRFLENRNNIFEENSLKAFLRQSFRVFDFSNLSSDSRYLESVTLNATFREFRIQIAVDNFPSNLGAILGRIGEALRVKFNQL